MPTMSRRHVLIGGILLVFLIRALAQNPIPVASPKPRLPTPTPATPGPAKQPFSAEGSVIEQTVTRIAFQSDGTFTRDQQTRIRAQSDAGVQQYSILKLPYEASFESLEILAVKVTKSQGSVVETPKESVQDVTAGSSANTAYYSDLREKHIAVKGLGAGDTLEFSCRWIRSKPLAPGQFWYSYQFQKLGVVLDEQLEIRVPREREVKVKSQDIQPTTREEGGQKIFSWKTAHLDSISAKELGEEQKYNFVRGLLPPLDVMISSFHTWDEVGRWYESLQQEKVLPSPEVKAKAQELVQGLTSDDAKLRALYNYVSLHNRYVGIAFGIGRYQPHGAAEILGNQYGDCKDKHTLLAALASASGLKAYPALISSQRAVDLDVPSPGQFDHVISVAPKGSELSWMDTTAEVGAFGYLLIPLRDKPALLITPEKVSFQDTPAGLPFVSKEDFHLSGRLSADGVLTAHAEDTTRDDGEYFVRLAFRRISEAQWKDLVQSFSYAQGFAGTISDPKVGAPDDTEVPFQWSYNYERKDYSDWQHHQILSGLPSLGLPALSDEDVGRKIPQWLGGPSEFLYESRIELPKGYTAQLPANLDLKEPFAEFQGHSEVVNGVYITHRRLLLKSREVPPDLLKSYKSFEKAISDNEYEYAQLTATSQESVAEVAVSSVKQAKKQFGPATLPELLKQALTDLPSSTNAESLDAESQGRQLLARDPAAALAAFRQAVKLDPAFCRGWVELGLAYLGNDKDASLEAWQKAAAADPKQVIPLKLLAMSYEHAKRRPEAIAAWQKVQQIAPDDADPAPKLGWLLAADKRYAEAAAMFETAAKSSPYSAVLQISLGSARLRAGDNDKGLSAMRHAIELDAGDLTLNNVAYEMAEAGAALPEALGYSQRAVKLAEERSRKINPENVQPQDKFLASSLSSYWDTLGWIHFKMGNLPVAENYLNAAWLLSQAGTIGDHLGQVLESEHKPALALHAYTLAVAANSELPETPQRIRKLSAGTRSSTHMSAAEELSRMRSVPLPRVFKGSANADFDLLLAPGERVERAVFLSGSEPLRNAGVELEKTKLNQVFPPDSSARLLRRGILSCNPYTGCSVVFYPLRSTVPQSPNGN